MYLRVSDGGAWVGRVSSVECPKFQLCDVFYLGFVARKATFCGFSPKSIILQLETTVRTNVLYLPRGTYLWYRNLQSVVCLPYLWLACIFVTSSAVVSVRHENLIIKVLLKSSFPWLQRSKIIIINLRHSSVLFFKVTAPTSRQYSWELCCCTMHKVIENKNADWDCDDDKKNKNSEVIG